MQQHIPLTNITIPVFNRHDTTVKVLFALRQHTPRGSIVTVVDNGSDEPLRKELQSIHQKGIIDNLYILERNYGVSCACNVGWRLVDAPFFMKLDNDVLVLSETWLSDIYGMWGARKYDTIIGPTWNATNPHLREDTPYGTLWKMPESLSGAAMLVSRKVRDSVGVFSEDYGLYGEEDADYCMRCHFAKIRKFTFDASPLLHLVSDEDDYTHSGFSKREFHEKNTGYGRREGIFALNLFLYEHSLRALRVGSRYYVQSVNGQHVTIGENQEYVTYLEALHECCDIFNGCDRKPAGKTLRRIISLLDVAAGGASA